MSLTLKMQAAQERINKLKEPEVFNKLTSQQKDVLANLIISVSTKLDDFIRLTDSFVEDQQ
jgi:hypothetical protein